MKKFYSLLVASAVVLSASAFNKVISTNESLTLSLATETPVKKVDEKEKQKTFQSNVLVGTEINKQIQTSFIPKSTQPLSQKVRMISARKVASESSLQGTWTFLLGDYYFEDSVGEMEYTFEATLKDDGYLYFEDPNEDMFPMVAKFDASNSSLNFVTANWGSYGSEGYYLAQVPFVHNNSTNKIEIQQTLVGIYNETAGTISFNADQGLGWAPVNSQNQIMGWYIILDFLGATMGEGDNTGGDNPGGDNPGGDNPGGDNPGGDNGSIEGTWVFNMGDYYFQDSVEGTIQITYKATLQNGLVVFEDVTTGGYEPPFVGVYNEAAGTISFEREYIGSAQSYYVYQEPFRYDYTAQGLISINALVGTYNASAGTLSFTTDQGIMWPAYTNQAGTGEPVGYIGIYDFESAKKTGDSNPGDSGVIGIDTDNIDAVYYDFSGRRIENPETGLYIKVVSGKASKVIVK